MPKMAVYVSDTLRERMKRWPDENWSRIAQRAFEVRLGQLTERVKMEDRSTVIERLRASRLEDEESLAVEGRKDGKRWATSPHQRWRNIRRLAGWEPVLEAVDWGGYVEEVPALFEESPREFWINGVDLDDTPSDDAYAAGFVEGVRAVYSELRDDVER